MAIIELKELSVLFFLISASYINATEMIFSILFLKIYPRIQKYWERDFLYWPPIFLDLWAINHYFIL